MTKGSTSSLDSATKDWDIPLQHLLRVPSLSLSLNSTDMYTDDSTLDVPPSTSSSESATLLNRAAAATNTDPLHHGSDLASRPWDDGFLASPASLKPSSGLSRSSLLDDDAVTGALTSTDPGLSKMAVLYAPLKKIWHGPAVARDIPPRQIKFLQPFEDFPQKIRESIPLSIRVLLLAVYLVFWFLLCYSILIPYLTVPPANDNDPSVVVVPVSCLEQSAFWNGKNGACGINGELCPTYAHDAEVVFRCPALCDRGSYTFSFLPIGDQLIKYRGYFVGGGSTPAVGDESGFISRPYRADSYPCGAAIHSGTISPFFGGCTKIKYTGGQPSFPSTKGAFGVDVSIPFLSFFQSSFRFVGLDGAYLRCYDPRLLILVINIVLGLPVVYLGSGAVTYWTITTVGFWTIALATDPPRTVDASDYENFADLISLSLGRFLPTCFILYVLWGTSVKRTLKVPKGEDCETDSIALGEDNRLSYSPRKVSVVYKLILFYPMFWLGVLNNITFDRLPVDRLTILDIQSQPGALFAVGGIFSLIIICAFIQGYKIWLSGRFRKYLLLYLLFVAGLLIVASLPGLVLRIHHYILALILIPGCSTRGRTALMFQGILLGLFLLGASRWGLAAIAETMGSLKRNDPQGTVYPPIFEAFDLATGLLNWKDTDKSKLSPIDLKLLEKYNGFSLLVNDVERYISSNATTFMNLTELFQTEQLRELILISLASGYRDSGGNIPIYLRIGRKIMGSMLYSDFSKAAVLMWPSGEFALPEEGVT